MLLSTHLGQQSKQAFVVSGVRAKRQVAWVNEGCSHVG